MVLYASNVLGSRGPRKMQVGLMCCFPYAYPVVGDIASVGSQCENA